MFPCFPILGSVSVFLVRFLFWQLVYFLVILFVHHLLSWGSFSGFGLFTDDLAASFTYTV